MLTINADHHPLMRRMHKPDPQLPPDAQDKRSVIVLEQAELDRWLWGSMQDLSTVFGFADVTMGLLALVNLFAVFMLFKTGLRLMRDYDEQISAGVESPVLDAKKFADLDLDPSVWSANAASNANGERAEIGHAVHQR